ncbi:MAG: aspartate/glutamate racemase family protein, partial [Anaerolineales bacterium]|nr:aspartate/glutamate racemase family protein [Anaerolineales bacterium]
FPDTKFVGMEPAVKPASEGTVTGKVGVLATPTTFQGTLYASLLDRYAEGITIYQHTCPGLVSEIEAGRLTGTEARRILTQAIEPMLAAGVDQIVLGCTHYPFVLPLIREIAGPEVTVVDPAPAVARQTARVLKTLGPRINGAAAGDVFIQTTGDAARMEGFLNHVPAFSGVDVVNLKWVDGYLQSPTIHT